VGSGEGGQGHVGDDLSRRAPFDEVTLRTLIPNRKNPTTATTIAGVTPRLLSSLVTHEASYLPFVLSRSDTSGSPPNPIKLRGRRTWNKRGQEVVTEAATEVRPCPRVRVPSLTHLTRHRSRRMTSFSKTTTSTRTGTKTGTTNPVGHLPPGDGSLPQSVITIITLPRNGLRRYRASGLAPQTSEPNPAAPRAPGTSFAKHHRRPAPAPSEPMRQLV
jgi:hypothetical protein